MDPKVFAGINVIDFGWAIAGPLTLKYLADYGATVICIESIERPDLLRTSAPFKDGVTNINRAGFFSYFAANKYSISLDLKNAVAKEIAKKLVAWADVVADSHRPGVLESWGLGYDELSRIKPDIIMIRSSNQGLTGPSATQPGLGNHINGLGGIVNLVGFPDEEPISPMVAYTDYCVPHFAASALISALDHRNKTGKGQLIDVSQFESGLQLIAPLLLDYSTSGMEARANGNSCEYAAPHGVFRCKGEDRWCAITVFTDDEWQSMCKAMGNPEWTKAPEFSTLPERKKHEARLNHLVEQWTSQYEPEHIMVLLQQEGVAAGVVQDAKDICSDSATKRKRMFLERKSQRTGRVLLFGTAIQIIHDSRKAFSGGPRFGRTQ